LVVVIVPLLPGLVRLAFSSSLFAVVIEIETLQIHSMGVQNIGQGILNFYTLTWVDGVVMSVILYYALYLISPFELGSPEPDMEIKYSEPREKFAGSEGSIEKEPETRTGVLGV
jgi:hypothetical protein